MDSLKKSTFETSRGITYTYYTSSAKDGKPTLLLLHGWPDHAALWEGLITQHLVPAGYGAVAPDCLGYDGTDKPLDPAAYTFNHQTADMVEILDHEGLSTVIPLGHDWGAPFAQRMYVYHPARCIGLANLNVAFRPQTAPGRMDLRALAALLESRIGYFPMWYWTLFSDPVEGPKLLDASKESMWAAMHGDPASWRGILCTEGGTQAWLREGRTQPVQAYATDEMKDQFVRRFERDGFAAPLMWYRSHVEGFQGAEEAKLPAERFTVNVPYLFVAGLKDVVCLAGAIQEPKAAGLLPKLTMKEVDAGHWSMLSHPQEVGEAVVSWLKSTF